MRAKQRARWRAAPRDGLLASALALSACVIDHGAGWSAAEPETRAAASFLLIGDPAPGLTSRRVAEELERALASERAAGRLPIVLWLGNQLHHECSSAAGTAWTKGGLRELDAVVARHVQSGGQSFAILGHRDLRCAPDARARAAGDGARARRWAATEANVVVRVDVGGKARVVSRCSDDAQACTVEAASADDRLDLVMLEVTGWIFPPAPASAADEQVERSLAQQARLLDALHADAESLPRILVTHVPVEAAGVHGLGGLQPTATFGRFPPRLRRALAEGDFVGVFSAHERDLEVTADLGPAIQRSSKTWIHAPLFQVTSGAAGRPDRRTPGPRTTPGFQGIALHPDLRSSHGGFARVLVGDDEVAVVVHAHRRGDWDRGVVEFALRRAAHPSEVPGVPQAPCLRCDPLDGAAGGPRRELERGR